MPLFSKEVERYHIERVRGFMTTRPGVGPREISVLLQKSRVPLELSEDYVGKLRRKIIAERSKNADPVRDSARIAQFQDKTRYIQSLLWNEAIDPTNPAIARIKALREISLSEIELFNIEKACGFFDPRRNPPPPKHPVRRLKSEELEHVENVMRAWGVISDQSPKRAHSSFKRQKDRN